jgi:protocatechuate 3,4-dioxygenase beta subunit
MLRRIAAPAVLAAALAASAFAQAPAAVEQNAPQAGSISGKVTLDGKPAAGVSVRLPKADFDAEQKRPLTTTTDAEGTYEFREVAPGRYFLSPYAPGYTGPNLGWGYAGSHVSVAPGEEVKNVDVALERGGAVTGKVTDGEGRPLIELPVYLFRAEANGKKQIVQVPNMQFMMTDDRGVYRIYGVPSGRYFVAVGKTDQQLVTVSTDLGRDYPLTYYPGTTNEAEAKEVAVSAGGEASGVNIAIGGRGLTYALAGRVLVPERGAAASSYFVVYGPTAEGQQNFIPTSFGAGVAADGKFRIEGLAPGTYGLTVVTQPNTAGAGYGDLVTVTVADADLTDVDIPVHGGATVAGTLVIENPPDPAAASSVSKFMVAATVTPSEPSLSTPLPVTAGVGADGSFALSGLKPGLVKLLLQDFTGPKGFSILRIERENVPIENGILVGEDETIANVRVVIGHGTAVIRGQVTFENGKLPKDHELIAIATRVGGAMIARPFRVDERGQFVVEGLATGDYTVTLWAVANQTKVFEFKPGVEQTVSVGAGSSATMALTIDWAKVELVERRPW